MNTLPPAALCPAAANDERRTTWEPVRPTTLDEHRRLGVDSDLVVDTTELLRALTFDDALLVDVSPDHDLFAGAVGYADLDAVFAAMLARAVLNGPSCEFKVCTQHAAALHQYLTTAEPWDLVRRWSRAADAFVPAPEPGMRFSDVVERLTCLRLSDSGPLGAEHIPYGNLQSLFPLPNLAAGVYVALQSDVDREVPRLNDAPIATRFVHMSPLEELDLSRPVLCDRLGGRYPFTLSPEHRTQRLHMLDQVLIDPRVGSAASWLVELRTQCADNGIQFSDAAAPAFVHQRDTGEALECSRRVA